MKEYAVSSFDIAPNGKSVAVLVRLGFESPTSQQHVFALYVVPLPRELHEASSAEIEPLVPEIRFEYGITVSWSQDSRHIAYTTDGPEASGNVFVVEVETGTARNLTENIDVNLQQLYRPPLWIGESDALLCLGEGEVWKIPLNDGVIQNLTENFQFSVHDVFYPSEGYSPWTVDNAITIKAYDAERTSYSFHRFSLTDGTVTLLHEDVHRILHTGRFSKDVAEKTGEFIYVAQNNQEPPNIWINDTAFESTRRITDINPHLQNIDFGRSELIE